MSSSDPSSKRPATTAPSSSSSSKENLGANSSPADLDDDATKNNDVLLTVAAESSVAHKRAPDAGAATRQQLVGKIKEMLNQIAALKTETRLKKEKSLYEIAKLRGKLLCVQTQVDRLDALLNKATILTAMHLASMVLKTGGLVLIMKLRDKILCFQKQVEQCNALLSIWDTQSATLDKLLKFISGLDSVQKEQLEKLFGDTQCAFTKP